MNKISKCEKTLKGILGEHVSLIYTLSRLVRLHATSFLQFIHDNNYEFQTLRVENRRKARGMRWKRANRNPIHDLLSKFDYVRTYPPMEEPMEILWKLEGISSMDAPVVQLWARDGTTSGRPPVKGRRQRRVLNTKGRSKWCPASEEYLALW